MKKRRYLSQNIGNAGEYYLASYLSARNFVATLTLGRTEKYDLLVVNPKGRTFKLTVKSTKATSKHFILNEKAEKTVEKDLFYGFVRLNNFEKPPEFWIVPSSVVAKVVKHAHNKWRKQPNRQGGKHDQNNRMRIFFVKYHKRYPNPERWVNQVSRYYNNIAPLEKS